MPYHVKVTGFEQVVRAIRELPKAKSRLGVRQAMDAAGGVFKQAAKKFAPRQTGLLKRSISVKSKVPDDVGNSYVLVGPKRGMKTPIERTKRGTVRGIGKKRFASMPANPAQRYRNPTRYAHLVEDGTKRGVRGTRFLKRATQSGKDAAFRRVVEKMKDAVSKYTPSR